MKLVAYEDAIYQRDGDVLTVHRAFPLFMFGLAEDVDELVVLGRLDPAPGRSHYAVPGRATFVPLPFYGNAGDIGAVVRALIGTVRTFWRALAGADAVWINGPSPMALVLVALSLLRRTRVVIGVRQNTLAYARNRFPGRRAPYAAFWLMEAAWRLVGRFNGVSAVGPEIAGRYHHARRLHELAVSFVTDADLAAPRPDRPAGGPTRILSVGRLETEKNPVMLADVLAELVAGGGEWQLDIVGEGPLEDELRARLRERGVADHAQLLGYVPLDGGLLDRYRAADIVLHVSWTEGLPQVILEAFGARTPVVATEVGGVGPVARGAALLVGPGDPVAAAQAVRRLAGDPELAQRLVGEGLARARQRTAEAERRKLVDFIAGS